MGKRKILLIEDDWRLREATAEFLTDDGYDVLTADNGSAGVQIALESLPDLILCDISIPVFDGYEVFNILQNNPVTSYIPFIFLTAKAEKEDIRAGMQMGADDYITKPFDYAELIASISTRLRKYENLIRKSEEKFYALIDNYLIGVFIYRPDRFDFVNQKLAKILGYTIEELNEMSFEDIIVEEDKELVLDKIRKCFKSILNNILISFSVYRKNKTQIDIELSGTLTNIKGRYCIIGNIQEITEKTSVNEGNENKLPSPSAYIKISKREKEVLVYICQGLTNNEIGEKLFISQRTVEGHKANLLSKTGSKNTPALIMYAIKNRLVEL
ncbi:MAG: response regulator [Bacteroidota bacterium]|nr:response regulator [Bacteroidota bacterium]